MPYKNPKESARIFAARFSFGSGIPDKIDQAARANNITPNGYVRQAVLRCLEEDGFMPVKSQGKLPQGRLVLPD